MQVTFTDKQKKFWKVYIVNMNILNYLLKIKSIYFLELKTGQYANEGHFSIDFSQVFYQYLNCIGLKGMSFNG